LLIQGMRYPQECFRHSLSCKSIKNIWFKPTMSMYSEYGFCNRSTDFQFIYHKPNYLFICPRIWMQQLNINSTSNTKVNKSKFMHPYDYQQMHCASPL
jgi:hypothetical protein